MEDKFANSAIYDNAREIIRYKRKYIQDNGIRYRWVSGAGG